MYKNLEKYDIALECYQNEIIYSNGKTLRFVSALSNRGFCYGKLQKYNEAIMDYQQILSQDPNNLVALFNKGICH